MAYFIAALMGYLLGCSNMAYYIAKWKKADFRDKGTGNLGATNTAFVLGKKSGIFVLIFDILKSFFSYKIAKWLFPKLLIAGILASIGAILARTPVWLNSLL